MRALQRSASAPPVRHVHLGLGNFVRAHQAWYTQHAGSDWGIAAFSGRSTALAEALTAQGGLYTLDTRGPAGDRFEVVTCLAAAHPGADHGAWLAYLRDPRVHLVTTTVTEAGYLRGTDGGLDRDRPDVRSDVAALRTDPAAPVGTAPARIVAGLLGRRRADAGPLTLVPCDNLPGNGDVLAGVVRDLAELVDPTLVDWIQHSVSTVTTMVDRITPEPTETDRLLVANATGVTDRAPVVTEPFTEWVLSGAFAADRPRWEDAGATFTDDVTPFEARKLTLLNGGHSLLAYAGLCRGHVTIADAVGDPVCRAWLEEWWAEASAHLPLPEAELATYRAALLERMANPGIRHRLDQIAVDGSQKLPVRIPPTVRAERAAGRMPHGALRVMAAWVCHLRDGAVVDARAADVVPLARGPLRAAVRRVLGVVDVALAEDDDVVDSVVAHVAELGGR